METPEYLVSFGTTGDFGRFRATTPLTLRRGERVVVRGYRGLELAVVLRQATPGHAQFLPNTTLGKLLRRATPSDEERNDQARLVGQQLFQDARRLTAELGLPLEILDVEVMLDGKQAYLHHLSWDDYDERELVSRLSREHDLQIALHSLALAQEEEADEAHGCGKPGCGQESGGCTSCASGGCSSCGTSKPDEVQAYFAKLREEMPTKNRTPLL